MHPQYQLTAAAVLPEASSEGSAAECSYPAMCNPPALAPSTAGGVQSMPRVLLRPAAASIRHRSARSAPRGIRPWSEAIALRQIVPPREGTAAVWAAAVGAGARLLGLRFDQQLLKGGDSVGGDIEVVVLHVPEK